MKNDCVGTGIFKWRWEANDVWHWFYILSSNAWGEGRLPKYM